MGDWPQQSFVDWPAGSMIGPWQPDTALADAARCGRFTGTTAVWLTANLAVLMPFIVETPCTVTQFWWYNGTAVSGNVDIGLFSWAGSRLVSAGATVQAGTSTIQVVNTTDTAIGPGDYYLGMVMDNITGNVFRSQPTNHVLMSCGVQQMATAYPLPATVTFANPVNSWVPVCGACTVSGAI